MDGSKHFSLDQHEPTPNWDDLEQHGRFTCCGLGVHPSCYLITAGLQHMTSANKKSMSLSLSLLRTVELEVPSVPGHALGYLPNFTDHLELNSNHLCALKSPGWYRFDPYIHGNDDLPQRTCIFDGHYHPILGKSWCGSIVQFPIHETESGSH